MRRDTTDAKGILPNIDGNEENVLGTTTIDGNNLDNEEMVDLWAALNKHLDATKSGRKKRDTTNDEEQHVDLWAILNRYLDASTPGRRKRDTTDEFDNEGESFLDLVSSLNLSLIHI